MPEGVLRTFDDGLKDHYTWVMPELAKRNIAGIFYINTGVYTTGKLADAHRIHLLLGGYGGKLIFEKITGLIQPQMLTHNGIAAFKEATYQTQQNDNYTSEVKRILNYYMDDAYRLLVLDKLMQEFFPEEKDMVKSFYISTIELKEMQQQGMIIGSHTVNHPVMSKLNYRQQQQEIQESFQFLETVTGRLPLRTSCYPYGGFHSFNTDTEEILENEKVHFSFNVEPRDITTTDLLNRPHALPRYDCNMFPHGKIYQPANI